MAANRRRDAKQAKQAAPPGATVTSVMHGKLAISTAAKTDYAANEGDCITDTREGPRTREKGDWGPYRWRDTSRATGIFHQRSQVPPAMIQDGLSMTYLIGEKYVSTRGYDTFEDPGYDQRASSGMDVDPNRWVLEPPEMDGKEVDLRRFGSAHLSGCHFVFCDGSVRQLRPRRGCLAFGN